MKEKWKEIYNGFYKVSNKGKLKRNKSGSGTYIGKILKLKYRTKDNMYPSYNISINGTVITREIHKLVAEAFIGPCPKGKEVNHIDCNKENPCSNNLEYVSRLENIRHSVRNGLNYVPNLKGEKHGRAKLNRYQVRMIRFVYKTKLFIQQEIADIFEVDRSTISDITNYRNWVHI